MSTHTTFSQNFLRSFRFLCTGIAFTTLASGCGGCNGPAPIDPSLSLQVGSKPFLLDSASIQDLWISKRDPSTGDQWSARFKVSATEGWEVASAPNDQPLSDRKADRGFIDHLLETVRTLEVTEANVKITSDAAGLSAPRWIFRWNTPEGLRELALGQNPPANGGSYARLPGLSPLDQVHVVRGAFLGMLEHLKSFDVLRHRRLSTWGMDDVWDLEVYQGIRKTFYAQRQNGEWANAANQIYDGPVNSWLERLLHVQILRFEDDPAEASRLFKKLSTLPTYQVKLKDRNGKTRWLAIGFDKGIWWGLEETRADTVFRMESDIAGYFLPPRVKTKKASAPNSRLPK